MSEYSALSVSIVLQDNEDGTIFELGSDSIDELTLGTTHGELIHLTRNILKVTLRDEARWERTDLTSEEDDEYEEDEDE